MTDAPQSGPVGSLPIHERKRKFVVVIDDSPESKAAIRFAAARAAHTAGGGIVLFHVILPARFQHWLGVQNRMMQESREEAEELLRNVALGIKGYCGLTPEQCIREGDPKEEIRAYIEDEAEDVFALILGAGAGDSPGPLVDYFSGPLAGSLKCPLVIVPGSLTDSAIDELA